MVGHERAYEILRTLGEGGMGVVYLARQRSLDRLVALKVVRGTYADDPHALLRFVAEGRAFRELAHPNIVRLLDFEIDTPEPFLVFEYVEGGRGLDLVLDRTPPPLPAALLLASDIAAGLAHMHAHGIVHRDLKPGNVLLDAASLARIIDLGLARATSVDRTRLTEDGVVLGTLAYMSLEQASGKEVTPRTDVYAFGLILYELLARRLVFGTRGPQSVSPTDRLAGRIPLLAQLAPEAPVRARMLVERCMAEDPGGRPADGAAVHRELAAILEERAIDPTSRRLVQTWPPDAPPAGAAPGLATGAVRGSGEPTVPLSPERIPVAAPAAAVLAAVPAAVPAAASAGPVAAPAVSAARVAAPAPARPPLLARDGAARSPAPGPARAGAPGARDRSPPPASPRDARVPGRRPSASSRLAAAGLLALIVVVGLHRARSGVEPAPVSSPAPDLLALSGARLRSRLEQARAGLSLSWLERFAREHRGRVRKEPGLVERAMRDHLAAVDVLAPLAAWLPRAREYFAAERIPLAERWALRSALVDVELLECFCREVGVPWCMPSTTLDHAETWDEPVPVPTPDLSRARTFIRTATGDENRFFPGLVWSERWTLPPLSQAERPLLWFSMLRWRTGLVLDVRVGPDVRRLVRFRPPRSPPPGVRVFAVEWSYPGQVFHNTPTAVLDVPEYASTRGFMGTWLPRSCIGADVEIAIRMVDLPLSPGALANEALLNRIVSFVPVVPHSAPAGAP